MTMHDRSGWVALGAVASLLVAGLPATSVAAPSDPLGGPTAKTSDDEADPGDESSTEADEAAEPEPEVDPEQAKRDQAKKAYGEGSDLYELGKYPEAIEQFKLAWELSKEVQLLFNLGQAYWKWYDVDPDVDHLRQAAVFFRNYDKRMRLREGYQPAEIETILTAIEAQIEVDERKAAEAARPVIVQPGGPTEEELAWQQRQRTTKGLVISGTTITVLGGLTLAAGVAGLLSRVTHQALLDNSVSGDGGINIATADEDARRRNGYLVSGQVAFGALIAAAIVVPIGVGLRVAGAIREKKDRATARERDQERERNEAKAKKVAIQPSVGGLTVRF